MRRASVIIPVKVKNTGQKELLFEHDGVPLPPIILKPGETKDLPYGKYRVIVKEYEPVEIAKIQYPNDKKFSVEAEKGVEGAQFESDVPVRPQGLY